MNAAGSRSGLRLGVQVSALVADGRGTFVVRAVSRALAGGSR
jgi:hypothetical protein